MPAPAKSWTAIADTSVDADSPLDETLLTALRNNAEHLEEWLGKDYTAATNHNHDGVNSAAIEIGPNLLRNGSFESDGTSWTTTAYTGGSIAFDTANDMDGAKCLAITSTVLANGGGDALGAAFIPVTGGEQYLLRWSMKASTGNVASSVQVLWYDDTQSSISTSTLFAPASTTTTARKYQRIATAPSTARFAKVKLIGGVPATGSATGTIYFDGVHFTEPQGDRVLLDELTASSSATLDLTSGFVAEAFDEYELDLVRLAPATNSVNCWLRLSVDGGSTFKSGASDYTYALTGLDSAGSAVSASGGAGAAQILLSTGSVLGNTNADRGISATVRFSRPDSTDNCTGRWDAHYGGINPVSVVQGTFSMGDFNAAMNGIRVMMSSGNITSGTARLYGIRKGV